MSVEDSFFISDYEASPYSLLTRLPHPPSWGGIRLACVKHLASVHSEPGSNSCLDFGMED